MLNTDRQTLNRLSISGKCYVLYMCRIERLVVENLVMYRGVCYNFHCIKSISILGIQPEKQNYKSYRKHFPHITDENTLRRSVYTPET